jgi:UDPglucose 6-dehydrogenase
MRVSVIGLGKLGLCTAACFASRGNSVHGFDADPGTMVKLKAGGCPIREPGLDELLASAAGRFVPCKDAREAVEASEMTLIIVPTPSEPGGRFSTEFVEAVLRDIAPSLRKKDCFHVVDVVSTVMPGASDNVFKPLLEKETGKTCGRDFGLVYNPEFIALGSVIRDFMHPDMVLIGASDPVSSAMIRSLYESLFDAQPRYAQMSLINAEITKLSLNCFVTMKISFANELAALCEKIPGADVDDITRALGEDSRIGVKCLTAGLGFGGPCFPRDNLAFQECCREHGYEARLGPAVVGINRRVPERAAEMVKASAAPGSIIALLGMAYKPGTHIIEESHSVRLAEILLSSGYRLRIFDPRALDECRRRFGESVEYCGDAYTCCDTADAVVVLSREKDPAGWTGQGLRPRAAWAWIMHLSRR